ncbi:MAG: sulfatase-like hydrolase/transferase, partial [Treponema sp.]|nr:sulfatase-like hydrolase/transferase [Treponema sp.]
MNKQPNILFILTDDQRYNTIHALGNKQIITPNMDSLVRRGTSFLNAHIPCGTVGAVCMPSRAMLHSGRSLFRIDDVGQEIPVNHTTLGEQLRNHGYNCFGTGKWHNGPKAFNRSFNNGDNIFFGGMWDHWNVPMNFYDPTGEYDNVINVVVNHMLSNNITRINCDKFNPGKHSSELLTDTALNFLQGSPQEPFFLYVAYLAPHDPRTMPEKFRNMYNPADIELPENFKTEHPIDFGFKIIRDEKLAKYPRDPAEVKKQLAEYYGMITHLDYEMGRLLDNLDHNGMLDDTIVILSGDNGLAMGCHGLMGKQNNYEHSVRVPLVMAGPGIPVNQTREQYLYLFDIFPTLCEMLNIEIPASVEGRSFAKMLNDPSYITRDKLYFAYSDLIRSVKDDTYKLIEYRKNINATQL